MYDILIKSGRIVDGTGADMYVADVGIKDGIIAEIGDLTGAESAEWIDGRGMIVSPGFIDMHSHGDGTILMFPDAESAIGQGITTFVGGQCGDSPAPRDGKYYSRLFWEYDSWYKIDNHTFYAECVQPEKKAVQILEQDFDIRFDYHSFDEYLSKIERQKLSVNFIPLVGHGTVRSCCMGPDCERAPSPAEMDAMKNLLRDALNCGAWGMSTGLDYAPSANADIDELVELAGELSRLDGLYSTHWRRTGIRKGIPGSHYKIDGVVEACEIGKRAGVRVELSHLMTGYQITPMPDKALDRVSAQATLGVIDSYISQGYLAAFDVIPNTSGGFECIPYLAMYLAPWVRMSGGIEHFAENLNSFDYREHLKEQLMAGKWYTLSPKINSEWDKEIIVTKSSDADIVGKSIKEIAIGKSSKDSIDVVLELLRQEPKIMVRQDKHNEGSVQEFLNHKSAMVGIDSYVFDYKGTFGLGMEVPEVLPHPNTYCGMVRYIENYGQERIEDTIRKITGFPAEWLRMTKRGFLRKGCFADIVIFDIDKLKSNESHIEPRQKPEGIEYVIVNGQIALNRGKHVRARSGKVLRFNNKELF